MAEVENWSHQKTTAMAIAPASRSAARTAESDLIQFAARDFGLISESIGDSWISSMARLKNAGRKRTNQLILDLKFSDLNQPSNSFIKFSKSDGSIGLVRWALNPACSARARSSYSE